MIRVAIVDDHAVLRAGLSRFLTDCDDLQVVASCASAREALDRVREGAVDVLSLSVKCVSTYRMRVLERLGLATNSQLTYYAVKNGLVD